MRLRSNINNVGEETPSDQVANGIVKAALALLGVTIPFVLFWGMEVAFFPTTHSRATGWILFVVSASVVAITVDRWVNVLGGVLALAVLNGIIVTLAGRTTSQPVPRLQGITITLFFSACAYLALTFNGRKLDMVDRASVIAFVLSFIWGLAHDASKPETDWGRPSTVCVIAMAVGACCLFAAWARKGFNRPAPKRSGDT